MLVLVCHLLSGINNARNKLTINVCNVNKVLKKNSLKRTSQIYIDTFTPLEIRVTSSELRQLSSASEGVNRQQKPSEANSAALVQRK